MTKGSLVNAARWLLVLPVSAVAANTAAWLFNLLVNFTYAFNIIQAPSTFEKNLYAVATCAIFGCCMVAAGAAVAPNRRFVVAGVLFSILLAVSAYTVYRNDTWNTRGFLAFVWEASGLIGYLAGGALVVIVVYLGERVAHDP